MNAVIRQKGECRTAPATPGLLNTREAKFEFSFHEIV